MTPTRDVIAEMLCRAAGPECDCGDSPCVYYRAADGLLASDSIRLELAALFNPWRPIETAPKDGTMILTFVPWLTYPKTLFWAKYADEWRCPATEDAHKYEPTHWLPLPTPPSEDT